MKVLKDSSPPDTPDPEEKRRRRFPWYNTVTMVVAVGGILFGIFAYLSSRAEKEPCFASQSTSLVSTRGSGIPGVQIRFRGKVVHQLTSTNIWFWNGGKKTIEGNDVASADRVRVLLPRGARLLSARVTKYSRGAVIPSVHVVNGSASLLFDFLDRGDGYVIQVLHTGESNQIVRVVGTIKGAEPVREVVATDNHKRTASIAMIIWSALLLPIGAVLTRSCAVDRLYEGSQKFGEAFAPPGSNRFRRRLKGSLERLCFALPLAIGMLGVLVFIYVLVFRLWATTIPACLR